MGVYDLVVLLYTEQLMKLRQVFDEVDCLCCDNVEAQEQIDKLDSKIDKYFKKGDALSDEHLIEIIIRFQKQIIKIKENFRKGLYNED